MTTSSNYPNSYHLHKALRDLETAIAMDGNIEYLRDLPCTRSGALNFTMDVSAFVDAIEGERE